MGSGPQMLKIELHRNGASAGREFQIVADPAVPGELRQHMLTAMWQLRKEGEDQLHCYSLWVTPVDSPRDRFEFIAGSNGG
jgi:hypothetical protein